MIDAETPIPRVDRRSANAPSRRRYSPQLDGLERFLVCLFPRRYGS
jgi:hypothetical protein